MEYSKPCLKQPLKKEDKIHFQDQLEHIRWRAIANPHALKEI